MSFVKLDVRAFDVIDLLQNIVEVVSHRRSVQKQLLLIELVLFEKRWVFPKNNGGRI